MRLKKENVGLEERIKVLEKESVPVQEHSRVLKSLRTKQSTNVYHPELSSFDNSHVKANQEINSEHLLKPKSSISPHSNSV